jgi:site-specific recombinase XerD
VSEMRRLSQVSVMRHASEDAHGFRLRAMIVMPWRGGLRVKEALTLSEHDLDPQRGSVLVRCGKGGRRREVGMDGGVGRTSGPGPQSDSSFRWARCSA